jgi:FkbM family methyltransferase
MKNISTLHSIYFLFQIDRIRQFLSFLSRNIRTTKNWPDLLLLRIGKKKTARAIFRDGTTFDISKDTYSGYRNIQESHIRKLSMKGDAYVIPFKQKEVLLKGQEVPILAAEIFFNGTYAPTNPQGRIVVDVGANIGDSAIYFALQGAKKVIAFEPYAGVFNTALENIRLNNIENIQMVRSAVGPKCGTLTIDPDVESNSGSAVRNHARGEEVPLLSLEKVVEKYGVSDGVLKMDCEGCEYDILLSAKNEKLACFSEIILEYHYGYLDLKKKLESAGFSVSLTGFPYRVHNKNVPNPNMVVGFIFATKKD